MDLRIDNTSPSCDARQTGPDNDGNLFTMKVLITGGAGFLGSRLARTLLGRGHVSGDQIFELVLADLVPPPADLAHDPRVRALTGTLLNQSSDVQRESP